MENQKKTTSLTAETRETLRTLDQDLNTQRFGFVEIVSENETEPDQKSPGISFAKFAIPAKTEAEARTFLNQLDYMVKHAEITLHTGGKTDVARKVTNATVVVNGWTVAGGISHQFEKPVPPGFEPESYYKPK